MSALWFTRAELSNSCDPHTYEPNASMNAKFVSECNTGALKRAIDVAVVLAVGLLTSPVLLLLAVLVKLTSRGPVIYRQVRVGLGGEPFMILKVRSMYHDCERVSGPKWSTENDPRVTPIGRLLRKTHLDEIPQLWNILKGEMSLVGPRPERPEFVRELEKALPRYPERLNVKPGLTGLAQVNLPPDVDQNAVRRKLVYDLYYVTFGNVWMDLRLLLSTGLFLTGIPFGVSTRWLGIGPDTVREAAERPNRSPHQGAELATPTRAGAAWNEC